MIVFKAILAGGQILPPPRQQTSMPRQRTSTRTPVTLGAGQGTALPPPGWRTMSYSPSWGAVTSQSLLGGEEAESSLARPPRRRQERPPGRPERARLDSAPAPPPGVTTMRDGSASTGI